jgi:hypothetical protein
VLNLTDEDRRAIVDILERELALRSDPGRPEQFDPPVAQDAADRLGRWHQAQGRAPAALHAAQVAGNAVEAGAPAASGLTALAMLGQQANRYRDIGDMTAVARVEETIRARAPEAKTGLRHIQIPIEIPPEELETWLDQISGATLEEGVARVTVNAIVRRASTERTVMDAAKQSPLSSRIPIAIMRDDGFTSAVIESVEDDLDGRVVHYAANLMGGAYAPFLNLSLERLRTKHGFTADAVVAWLSPCTFFAPNRLPLLRAGLDAWFAEDWIKAIHVLIPQVEAALRDVVRALGGAVMKPDGDGHGFQALTLGPLLRHERFVAGVPEDVRFHLSVLYQDSRGLNVRNEVAHGLAPMPLIDRAIANWVVHSILLVGLMRIQQPGTQPADGGAVSAEN